MPTYDDHEIKARLSKAYKPVFDILKKLVMSAEEILTEFKSDGLDRETVSTFMADLSELEGIYDEFLVTVEEVSQGLEYESRIAKEILNSFRKLKEMFGDIRIQAENLLGFIKPGLVQPNELLSSIIVQLNDLIKKLRTIISEELKYNVERLLEEQRQVEHLFPDERALEDQL